MTEGEKLVWAAVFAAKIHYNYPPYRSLDREEWEKEMVASAIENAWAAVASLREAGPMLVYGWGEDDDVYKMWDEMT